MKIAVACDHAGFPYKGAVIDCLREKGIDTIDLGCDSTDPVDYPDYAEAVGRAISRKEADRGILLCGSGIGVSIAANKIKGVRAAVCHDVYSARQGVEHNDMNILALGARVITIEQVRDLVAAFIDAKFSGVPRYQNRVMKITALEEKK